MAALKTTKSEGRGVQSIEIGTRLLSALVEQGEPMMLKDLAHLAGFAPAQAHAYLVSYRKIGLIEQDEQTGKYVLGRFALDIGIARMRTTNLMSMACETLTDLSHSTGLHGALVVWGTFGPTVVQVQESGSQLNMNTRPGAVYSMSGTSSGCVFSAFMPESLVKDAIRMEKREAGKSGRVGAHRFLPKKELEEIRETGYSMVEDPPVPGISAIAAPVFDHIGQIVLAVTLIGQDDYIKTHAEAEFIPSLLEETRKLSAELGYDRVC